MLHFRCPRCETPMEVDESFAGRSSRCATCGNTLRIPKVGETPPAGPRAPTPRSGATAVKVHGESVQIEPPLETTSVASAATAGFSVVLLLVFGVVLGKMFYPSGWMIGFILGTITAFLGAVFGLSAYYNIRRSKGRKGGRLWAQVGMYGGLGLGVVLLAGSVVSVITMMAMRPTCEQNLKSIYEALSRYAGKHDGHLPKDLQTLVTDGYLASDAALTCPAYRVPTGKQTYRLVPAIPMNDPLFPGDMMIVADGDPVATHEDGNVRVLLKDGSVKLTPAATWPAFFKDQENRFLAILKQKRRMAPPTETAPALEPDKPATQSETPAPEKERPPAAKENPAAPPARPPAVGQAPAKPEEGGP